MEFQLPPYIFYWVQVWRLARPLKDLEMLLMEPILSCPCCVFGVIVMLKDPATTHLQCSYWGKEVVGQNLAIHDPLQGSRVRPNFSRVRQKKSEGALVPPAVREKKNNYTRLRVSLCFNNRHTLGSYRGLNQSEIVNPKLLSMMHFCYSQIRSEIALTWSFGTRNMKALFMIEERTNH